MSLATTRRRVSRCESRHERNSGRAWNRAGRSHSNTARARLLATAVALVLMIACANVAGLMLTRASGRQREVAVRMAMGAGRGQLLRQWLTEAVLLGLAGSAAGLLLTVWTPSILRGLGIPESVDLSVNLNVLAFTLAVGVTSGLVFGIAPVLQFVRKDALSGLREDGGAVVGGSAARLRSAFVVVQVALSLVLMVGAGLFVRTLMQAYAVIWVTASTAC